MTAVWTTAAGVLAAGAVFGFVMRRRARAQPASTAKFRERLIVATVGLAIGGPIVLILLANVLGNNALGWLFAMSLVADAALVPATAVFLIGYAIGASIERKTCLPGDLYPSRSEVSH